MKRIYPIRFLSLPLLDGHTTATAGHCVGVKMQDSVTLHGQTLVPNGMGQRLATFLKGFQAVRTLENDAAFGMISFSFQVF